MSRKLKRFLLAAATLAVSLACTPSLAQAPGQGPARGPGQGGGGNNFGLPHDPPAELALGTTTVVEPAPGPIGAATRTQRIVEAATAFMATLTDAQRAKLMFAFSDADQRKLWSNFPDGTVNRKGVRLGEMKSTQKWALWNLLAVILSPDGMQMINDQAAAEDILKVTDPTQTREARFGSDYFYAAILGTPSTTDPWELQFGAHHLAVNATIAGPHVTLSPTMTGGQPLKYIDGNGKPVYITEVEARRGLAFLRSLTPAQQNKAVVSTRSINLILGPGHDGQTLQPEGLSGKEMTAAQKTQFLGVIDARLGMLNADTHAEVMAAVRKNLDQTWFGWWGPTDQLGVAYFRVTGPTLIVEYSPQGPDERYPLYADHAHNMYRDPTNEYGSAWTSVK
jgi:hypothetical protein